MIQKDINEVIDIFKNHSGKLINEYNIKLAYIFGSYAKGNNVQNSDLGIAVLLEKYDNPFLKINIISDLTGIFKRDDIDLVILNNVVLFGSRAKGTARKKSDIDIYNNVKLESLQNHILELENELLKSEIRCSSEKISQLLSENFIEFCSSGKVYHYSVGDVFDNGDNISQINWEIKGFQLKEFAVDCVLATYKLIKHNEFDESKKFSLRSSIWKLSNDTWKMVFHQGTLYKL